MANSLINIPESCIILYRKAARQQQNANVKKRAYTEKVFGQKLKKHWPTTILDIKSVHFLQFQRDFIPQAKLEEAFIYI